MPIEDLSRVRHANVRQRVDPAFRKEHDKLSAAYYGRQCRDVPFTTRVYRAPSGQEFDFEPSAWPSGEERKAQFDLLHGLIATHLYALAFHAEVQKMQGEGGHTLPDRDEYDPEIYDDAVRVGRVTEIATAEVQAAQALGITLGDIGAD